MVSKNNFSLWQQTWINMAFLRTFWQRESNKSTEEMQCKQTTHDENHANKIKAKKHTAELEKSFLTSISLDFDEFDGKQST